MYLPRGVKFETKTGLVVAKNKYDKQVATKHDVIANAI